MREVKPRHAVNPRRQTKRDARKYVEQTTGKGRSWKAARKWLKRQARKA